MKTKRKLPGAKFGRRYPWEDWFRRRRFTLVRGVDFNGRTDTMLQQIRNAAGPRKYNVRISIVVNERGDEITVIVGGPKG